MSQKLALPTVVFAIAALGLSLATAQAATLTYDVANDFSAINNPNGAWSFGTFSGSTFNAFSAPSVHHGVIQRWNGASSDPSVDYNPSDSTVVASDWGTITWAPHAVLLNPYGGAAVARWTATTAGTADLNAVFTEAQVAGTPPSVTIYRNNTQEWTYGAWITGSTSDSTTATLSGLSVAAGDTIDFVVSQNGSKTIRLAATITETTHVPEPSTLLLVATGLLGLMAYAWRKRR